MTRARSKRILINLNFYDLENKPLVYPPEAHTHAIVDVDGLELALDDLQDQIDTLDTDKASKSYARHLGAFVSFTDENGQTIDPAGLNAWGIKLVTRNGKVLHKAGTLTGFSSENVVEVTTSGIVLLVPAALNPRYEIDVYAISIIELPTPSWMEEN